MAYARDEMETTCVFDYMTKTWEVYTCVPTHITKLSKIAEPHWKEEEQGTNGSRVVAGKWKLGKSQVRFAKLIELTKQQDDEEEDNGH